jgi:hypothetical protein
LQRLRLLVEEVFACGLAASLLPLVVGLCTMLLLKLADHHRLARRPDGILLHLFA